MGRKKRKSLFKTPMRCRDCGRGGVADKWDMKRAASPRCSGCGGIMDHQVKREPGQQEQKPTCANLAWSQEAIDAMAAVLEKNSAHDHN